MTMARCFDEFIANYPHVWTDGELASVWDYFKAHPALSKQHFTVCYKTVK